MKRSLKNLRAYTVQATDGPKGKVKDFLFDEESWIIRYLEADFGGFFNNKRVLVPKKFFDKPDWEENHFPVELDKEAIESSPDIDAEMPVSRQYEVKLNQHYGIKHYWPYAYSGTAAMAMIYPPRPLDVPSKVVSEEEIDTNLRSFKEVEGYHVKALDSKLGQVDDILVDEDDWQIVYLVIDTGNYKAWSKKVLMSINWMDEINYTEREISIKLHTDTIKKAPEYDGLSTINSAFENSLYEFYRNSLSG